MWRRQLVLSFLLIAGLLAAVSVGSSGAFFSNIEQSFNNLFQAAEGFEFDLLVNGVNDPLTVVSLTDLKPGDNRIVEKTVRVNGNQDEAKVYVHLKDLVSSQNIQTEPEIAEEATPIPSPKSDIENYLAYDLTSNNAVIIDLSDSILLPDAVSCWIPLGTIPQNTDIAVLQSFHFDETVTNWAQGDKLTFTEDFLALSTDAPEPGFTQNGNQLWNPDTKRCEVVVQATLYDSDAFTCENGAADTSGSGFGTAAFIANASTATAYATLVGALPNTFYDLWVNQYPDGCPLSSPSLVGAILTDSSGSGSGSVTVARVATATKGWISVVGGSQVLRSATVNFL